MTLVLLVLAVCIGVLLVATMAGGCDPIETVEIGDHRQFVVNGEPFFPIMLWAQSLERLDEKMAAKVNTFAGRRGDASAGEYLDAIADKGTYGVMHFSKTVPDHPHLLAWIHGDEPDLFKRDPGVEMKLADGASTTVEGSLDALRNGDKLCGPVFQPLEGAAVTFVPREPVEVVGVALWVAADPEFAAVKELVIEADGEEVCRETLERTTDAQRIELPSCITAKELTIRVLAVHPGDGEAGRINLVDALGPDGTSAFARLRSREPRVCPEDLKSYYDAARSREPQRPVFMTFTSNFMKRSSGFDEDTKKRIYPEYVKHTDVVGFDTYPIFGWNKPEMLHDVADGVTELCAIAGPRRPVYAWIETNAGSRWIDPEKQLPVTPQDTRAEVWMAIIRGATAIGYFTHSWWPEYDEFAPDKKMIRELARLNSRITRLAPAILAPPAGRNVQIKLEGGLDCHLKTTHYDGHLYIFAQNMDMERREAAAVLKVEDMPEGTPVEVVDEKREIRSEEGMFADDFGPLAEHVYRVRMR